MPGYNQGVHRRIQRLETRGKVFASYMNHLRRRNMAARTLESYADCLNIFADWLDTEGITPIGVDSRTLERFRVWLAADRADDGGRPVSLGRQSYYIAVLRDFYRFCHDQGLTLGNPAHRLRYPKLPKRLHRDILTKRELQRLLSQPGDDAKGLRDQVALRLMALSGLRVGELLGVTVSDLNLPQREVLIRHGKGGRDRLMFMDAGTQRVIARYVLAVNVGAGVLLDYSNRRSVNTTVKHYVRRARIGKPITCHSLRRTFCTLMLQAGVNLKAIGEMVGHASLETTARYTKLDIQSLSRVYHQSHPGASIQDSNDENP